jgi:hypothetical protein
LVGVAVGAVVGFGSCAGADAAGVSRAATSAAEKPLLGVLQSPTGASATLARLDPLSLKPVSRRVRIEEYHENWSLSPDALHVALGRGGQGIGIEIVDVRTLKLVRHVRTGIAAEALGWLAPRRLVAGLQRGGTVVVDPRTGRIVRRFADFSFPDVSAQTRQGLVMLLPQLRASSPGLPLRRVSGAVRLALVDVHGRLRSVTVQRIRLGVRTRRGFEYTDRAGLAVDPARARAYVVAADAPVAEVDLHTMQVFYHRLAPLLARPSARGVTGVLARERTALWLGHGRLLVVGRDFVSTRARKEALAPAGAALVDTAAWTWRTLDRQPTGAVLVGAELLVYGPGSYPAPGAGLRGYTLRGRRIFGLFDHKRVLNVQVAGRRAYVRTPAAVHVVELGSGKVIHDVAPPVDLVSVIGAR